MQLARRRFLGLGVEAPASVPRMAVVAEDCLALRGVACDLCRDSCDANAIRFTPRLGAPASPRITEACTGCGDCLPVCPAQSLSLVAGMNKEPSSD
jgi:ferredoxin-type protein NapF